MKVVHILKRLELIDRDIAELRKFAEGLSLDRTYSDALKISLELQINNLLNERVKLMDLRIENPPDYLVQTIHDVQVQDKPLTPFSFTEHEEKYLPKMFHNKEEFEDTPLIPLIKNKVVSDITPFKVLTNSDSVPNSKLATLHSIMNNQENNLIHNNKKNDNDFNSSFNTVIGFKKKSKLDTNEGGSLLKRLNLDIKKSISPKVATNSQDESPKKHQEDLKDLPIVDY